jgi:hypothetical protein
VSGKINVCAIIPVFPPRIFLFIPRKSKIRLPALPPPWSVEQQGACFVVTDGADLVLRL